MKVFTVYSAPEDILERTKYVQDGFCYSACMFNIFWFFYHKIWVQAVVFTLLFIGLAQLFNIGFISISQNIILTFIIMLYIGMTAKEYYGKNLERSGYIVADVIAAHDIDEAEYKYISKIYSKINEEVEELTNEKEDKNKEE